MFETLFSGTTEGGTFFYDVSYLIYIKRALLLAGVVISLSSPVMPYFALLPGLAMKTVAGPYVLCAKLGIIHSLLIVFVI